MPSARHARKIRSAISPRLATSSRRMASESRHHLAERLVRVRAFGSSLPRLTDLGGGTNIAVRLRLGVALILAAVVCATAGSARGGTVLIVTGHGWGHGVGMSQWGAYGYALHGWKYRRILAHYYPGTTMSRVGELRVRVLLAQGASSVTVGCATPIRVTDGRRLTRMLPAGTYGVGPRLVFPARKHGGGLSFGHFAVLACDRAPLTFDGRQYHGTLLLRSGGGGVSVVNGLSLDTYL